MDDDNDPHLDEQASAITLQAEQLNEQPPVRHSAVRKVPTVIENVDPFANINACSPADIDRLAQILEIRGEQPRQARMREVCFNAAGLRKGMSVVEVGCGTGVVTRELSRIAGNEGKVVGVDVSPGLLNHARRRSASDGFAVEYRIGNAYNLEFPPGAFDASCSITLLAHLTNLERVVAELVRVARETVMVLDQDYQTLVFENSNTALTRRILQHGADFNVVDGWCGRKLPGLLVRHRLDNVQCWPFVYAERDSHSYLITIAERFVALALKHDVVTDAEGRAWLQELYDRAVEGTFFASLNYYFAFGKRR
jgi:arsenite methyltransferase